MSYFLPSQSTQLTNRAALSQEQELETIYSQHRQESDEEVKRLHEIVRRSLSNFEVPQQPGTKRRRIENGPTEVDSDPVAIPFRLISWSLPAQPIRLVPNHHVSVYHQRPAEDTEDEAEQRRLRAEEASVDANRILTEGCGSLWKVMSTTAASLVLREPGINVSRLPNLLVAERHRSTTVGPASTDNECKLVSDDVQCCLLVPVTDQTVDDKPKRKRRKHRGHVVQDRPPPAFFRPMQEWGGKSAGYALGWQGSWPTDRLTSRRYTRDKMRTGIQGYVD